MRRIKVKKNHRFGGNVKNDGIHQIKSDKCNKFSFKWVERNFVNFVKNSAKIYRTLFVYRLSLTNPPRIFMKILKSEEIYMLLIMAVNFINMK